MSQPSCPVCRNTIRLVDSTHTLDYGGKTLTLHNRCYVENVEVFPTLESSYPGASLEDAMRRYRSGS
jgi:hypothetical protein